jgi:hypothetical protein
VGNLKDCLTISWPWSNSNPDGSLVKDVQIGEFSMPWGGRSSVTVCLISALTYTSAWVDWELSESSQKGNKIIAMGLKGVAVAQSPDYFRTRDNWFWFWNPAKLKELIENA